MLVTTYLSVFVWSLFFQDNLIHDLYQKQGQDHTRHCVTVHSIIHLFLVSFLQVVSNKRKESHIHHVANVETENLFFIYFLIYNLIPARKSWDILMVTTLLHQVFFLLWQFEEGKFCHFETVMFSILVDVGFQLLKSSGSLLEISGDSTYQIQQRVTSQNCSSLFSYMLQSLAIVKPDDCGFIS